MPHDPAVSAAKSFFLATLALEDALATHDEQAVQALMGERNRWLRVLETSARPLPQAAKAILDHSAWVEERIMESLHERRAQVVQDLAQGVQGRKAADSYRRANGFRG